MRSFAFISSSKLKNLFNHWPYIPMLQCSQNSWLEYGLGDQKEAARHGSGASSISYVVVCFTPIIKLLFSRVHIMFLCAGYVCRSCILCPTCCIKCPILYGCKIMGVQRLIMYVLYHRWLKVWVCCQWCDHLAWWSFEHLKFVLLLISWLFFRILQLKLFCSDYKHLEGKSSLIAYTKPYSHILKTFHPRGKLKSVHKGDIWTIDHSKLQFKFFFEMEFWVMDVSISNQLFTVKWTFR